MAAAGNPNIVDELKKGKQLGDRTYKVHLDGYNQMDMITGKGPSNRNEIFYFGESTRCGAHRRLQVSLHRPARRLARRKTNVDVPYLTNLRLDPFERTGWPENGTKEGAQQYFDWFKYEFWRFVFVQQQVEKLADDRDRIPADAEGRELQSRCREGKDRGGQSCDGQVVTTMRPAGDASRSPRRRPTHRDEESNFDSMHVEMPQA